MSDTPRCIGISNDNDSALKERRGPRGILTALIAFLRLSTLTWTGDFSSQFEVQSQQEWEMKNYISNIKIDNIENRYVIVNKIS